MNNKDIITRANQAVAKGDYDIFLDACTEDTRWTFIGDTTLNGKAEVLAYMKKVYIKPPIFDVEIILEDGDYVTIKGSIKLLQQDGQFKQFSYCDIWKFKDGMMDELQAFVI